jgi:hypothetical protein
VQFQQLLRVLHEELRTTDASANPPPLVTKADPQIPGLTILDRPRTTLEIARMVLLSDDDAFDLNTGSDQRFLVRRDLRGVAIVPMVGGAFPQPFVDANNAGLPDIDPLGRFVVQPGMSLPPSPFASRWGVTGRRDSFGRALGDSDLPLYDFFDTQRTFAATVTRDVVPLLDPTPENDKDLAMKLVSGALLLAGDRSDTQTKTYPADPSLLRDWSYAHTKPAPAGLGKNPVTMTYRGFMPETSALVHMVQALGPLVADPAMDDVLEFAKRFVRQNPNAAARLIGIGLRIKAIADKDEYKDVRISENSTFWDDLLDTVVEMAQVPGLLENLVYALKTTETRQLQEVFRDYLKYRDDLTYSSDAVNSACRVHPVTGQRTCPINTSSPYSGGTEVDWANPDIAGNRSAFQRFAQLLHDANGLSACTKKGAVVPIKWNGISMLYPSTLTRVACTVLGQPAPAELNECEVLGFQNVAALLVDVALGKPKIDVYDKCLEAILNSPISQIIDIDQFLEDISGINGFNLHPTVAGVGRLAFFRAKPVTTLFLELTTAQRDALGDPNPKVALTRGFLEGVIDPIASTLCPERTPGTPYVNSRGVSFNLRTCTKFADTLRGRDNNGLFPLEHEGFVTKVGPLAKVFENKPLLFVELFDTLHLHWGTTGQTKDICDPSVKRVLWNDTTKRLEGDYRWCGQSGLRGYEKLLVEVLSSRDIDVFGTLFDLIPIVEGIKVPHCAARNKTTGECPQPTVDRNGVVVLVDFLRVLVDPSRNGSLLGPKDNRLYTRNDGTTKRVKWAYKTNGKNPDTEVSPLLLLIDALKEMDGAFAKAADGTERQRGWKRARSLLVDTFLAVKNTGSNTTWTNQALPRILPVVLDMLQSQILAHCPDRTSSDRCAWAKTEMAKSFSDAIGGPFFAALLDFIDVVRTDDNARTQLMTLIQYLFDPSSQDDALVASLSMILDIMQMMSDEGNITPFSRVVAGAFSDTLVNDNGKIVRKGLVAAATEALARIFARRYENGKEICAGPIDPNRAVAVALRNFVTPMGIGEPTPLEMLADVAVDVNRRDPRLTTKLEPGDYANMAGEVNEFLLDQGSGLEQIYEVIRQATVP